jgi:Trypsin-co-occurring domain 2
MPQVDSGIPLADLVNAVRAELETAAVNARGMQLQFEVQDVQLEVEVVASGTREAEGGLKLWVVNVGATGSKTSSATQKVTLKLGAVTADGRKFHVSDVSATAINRT